MRDRAFQVLLKLGTRFGLDPSSREGLGVTNEGGVTGKVDISLEMGPTGDLWVTWCPSDVHRKSHTSS